jgi:polar amino acid transport system substrate-binding protein
VRFRTSLALLSVALLLAACGGPLASNLPSNLPTRPGATATEAAATAEPTEKASVPATETPTTEPTEATTPGATEEVSAPPSEPTETTGPSAAPSYALPSPPLAVCGPITSLSTKTPGRLTLSTDTPAFPPWWGGDPTVQYPNEPAGGDDWEVSDPYSMEGFEGATAYAVANAMGFTPDLIDWIQNTVFAQSFAPGPKQFDFHMAQVSIRPKRALNVDFSDPYFDAVQSLLALADNPITGAQNINDLKAYKLGAASNTTSFDLIDQVIQPNTDPTVYPDNTAALTALKNGQIDGIVVDLGTAFYMRDAQLAGDPAGQIVGQFSSALQTDEVGAVLQKDSPLTPCVNQAIAAIKANGTLQAIYDTWIVSGQNIPFLQ